MAQHERYHIGDNPSLWALSGGIVVRVERSETRGNTKSPAFRKLHAGYLLSVEN